MNARTLNIAVAGLGNVGAETVRLILKQRAGFAARTGVRLGLSWVCDRSVREKARHLGLPSRVRLTRDPSRILRDPGVDLVVELFGGQREAKALVLGALRAGKHVVTANKLLLSHCWGELAGASAAAERSIGFEAAVAGGIPIIQAIRSGLAANRIDSVSGILNGTTNYILSRMAHEGCELREALAEAQRLGMAERDPKLDLDGTDTAHKVSVLASMLTGRWLPHRRIPRVGIERIEAEDIRFGLATLGRTVRLIGTVALDWRSSPPVVEAHVQPVLVPLRHPLAAVHGGYNALLVQASSAGDLMFYGKGAGPGPAASAVLADILAIGGGTTPGMGIPCAEGSLRLAAESPAPRYLKLRVKDVPGALSGIAGILGRAGISIARIHQDVHTEARSRFVPVMITTHETTRRQIELAWRQLRALDSVAPTHTCLRMLQE
ncbi:MAG: hypothetical protein A2X36_00610 [Elusimicrobia bacterium GWA2_69_24]|nr:MAG: hypothetical protein A2X36_00610 [Elusimicrobia bacterium GWA2_69_24]